MMIAPVRLARPERMKKRVESAGRADQTVYVLVSNAADSWDGGVSYFDVEKRKKGEVSLKADTHCTERASAHNLLRTMLGGGVEMLSKNRLSQSENEA
jgi:hypothetical protein